MISISKEDAQKIIQIIRSFNMLAEDRIGLMKEWVTYNYENEILSIRSDMEGASRISREIFSQVAADDEERIYRYQG